MRCPALNKLPPPPLGKTCVPGGSGVVQRGWPWTEQSPQLPDIMPDGNPWPKVSIVTPSYNQGQFIEETIRSVLLQGYPNLEYIIIDGGSTDHSVEIIKKYEKWLSCWISEPDRGQSDAINKGLKRCTGKIFNWLNSDDYLQPNVFATTAYYLSKNPHINVICGKLRFINEQGTHINISKGTLIKRTIEETLFNHHLGQPATFYGNRVFLKMGLLSNNLNYQMDAEWWLRYLLLFGQNQVRTIPSILANYRIHGLSKTGMYQKSLFKEERKILLCYIAKINNVPEYLLKELERMIQIDFRHIDLDWEIGIPLNSNRLCAFYNRLYAYICYSRHDYNEARKELLKYIQNGAPDFNKGTLSLFIKTFCISKFLLDGLRKLKSL